MSYQMYRTKSHNPATTGNLHRALFCPFVGCIHGVFTRAATSAFSRLKCFTFQV
jgi:hypothetical protein